MKEVTLSNADYSALLALTRASGRSALYARLASAAAPMQANPVDDSPLLYDGGDDRADWSGGSEWDEAMDGWGD